MEKSKKEITLDASEKSYGRLASEVATLVRGKHEASFIPHEMPQVFVTIQNIEKVRFTGKKIDQNKIYSHSNYPGGLKEKSFKDSFKKDPKKVFLNSVRRMLPANKLRKEMLKHISFS